MKRKVNRKQCLAICKHTNKQCQHFAVLKGYCLRHYHLIKLSPRNKKYI